MANYLLICSDKHDEYGKTIGAKDYVHNMLSRSVWNLYQRTSFRDAITSGDRVFFYIAGEKEDSGHVVAEAEVLKDDTVRTSKFDEYGSAISKVLILINEKIYAKSSNLKSVIRKLSIGKKVDGAGKKWGSVLMGGAKKLTDDDVRVILGGSKV